MNQKSKYITWHEFEETEKKIAKIAKTVDEKHELWHLVDEIIHHRMLGCLLERLPEEKHEHLLKAINIEDQETFVAKLAEIIGQDAKNFLKFELIKIEKEIIGKLSN